MPRGALHLLTHTHYRTHTCDACRQHNATIGTHMHEMHLHNNTQTQQNIITIPRNIATCTLQCNCQRAAIHITAHIHDMHVDSITQPLAHICTRCIYTTTHRQSITHSHHPAQQRNMHVATQFLPQPLAHICTRCIYTTTRRHSITPSHNTAHHRNMHHNATRCNTIINTHITAHIHETHVPSITQPHMTALH